MSKRTATKPAAKRRRKTKSRAPAASRPKKMSWDMEDMQGMEATAPWGDETFFDEMAEWWDSPDGSLWLDICANLRRSR